MKRLTYFSLLVLAGCSGDEKAPPPPADLIPAEKIVPLIVDLQVLESHYERVYIHPALFKDALDSSSTFIFADHGVTKEQFDESYSYYASDISAIYGIYEAALDSINFRMNQTGL